MTAPPTYVYQVQRIGNQTWYDTSELVARVILRQGYHDPTAALARVDAGHTVCTSRHVVRRIDESEGYHAATSD